MLLTCISGAELRTGTPSLMSKTFPTSQFSAMAGDWSPGSAYIPRRMRILWSTKLLQALEPVYAPVIHAHTCALAHARANTLTDPALKHLRSAVSTGHATADCVGACSLTCILTRRYPGNSVESSSILAAAELEIRLDHPVISYSLAVQPSA